MFYLDKKFKIRFFKIYLEIRSCFFFKFKLEL